MGSTMFDVFTRRIQSDFLEHLFSFVKSRVGPCNKITAQQFRQAYRYFFVCAMMKSPSGANCPTTPASLEVRQESAMANDETDDEFESDGDESNDEDRTSFKINSYFEGIAKVTNAAAENAAIYLSSWAVKKIIKRKKCSWCEKDLLEFVNDRPSQCFTDPETLTELKAYDPHIFTNPKEFGYGHLLHKDHQDTFLKVNEMYHTAVMSSQNDFGTSVVRNILRELKKDSTVHKFLTDSSVSASCLNHRTEIVNTILRIKFYVLLKELKDGNRTIIQPVDNESDF
ncbi:hypothetical protein Fcan01_22310 [Folsomia candida]|uniref:Transposable element P transposase n=1 Tax=Folsomia candida TaxID=158441 RepID=A0A226DDQ9_FOLCA|nr:hypothetical protein Fcan01_22310 [Folsomia candida]